MKKLHLNLILIFIGALLTLTTATIKMFPNMYLFWIVYVVLISLTSIITYLKDSKKPKFHKSILDLKTIPPGSNKENFNRININNMYILENSEITVLYLLNNNIRIFVNLEFSNDMKKETEDYNKIINTIKELINE